MSLIKICFLSETTVFAVSGVIGTTRQGLVLWFDENPIYEANFHIIIRNEPPIVERFYRHLLMYTEAGIPSKLKSYFEVNSFTFFSLNTIYRTLEDFASANSKFDQLTIGNFQTLLVLYASFCFSIFLLFLLSRICSLRLFKRMRKWRKYRKMRIHRLKPK